MLYEAYQALKIFTYNNNNLSIRINEFAALQAGLDPSGFLLLSDTWPNLCGVLKSRTLDYAEYIFNIFLIVVFFFLSFFALIDDLHKPDPYAK